MLSDASQADIQQACFPPFFAVPVGRSVLGGQEVLGAQQISGLVAAPGADMEGKGDSVGVLAGRDLEMVTMPGINHQMKVMQRKL